MQLAMSEPVPHNWKVMYDDQGYPYYVNQVNGKTSRRHPSDAFYNQLVKYEKIRELTEGPRQEIGAWMDFTDFDAEGFDMSGNIIKKEADGLHARVVQHELDHLMGILYTSRLVDKKAFGFENEIEEYWKQQKDKKV